MGGRRGDRTSRGRPADDGDPPGPRRHPVRPCRRHLRLDAPSRLTHRLPTPLGRPARLGDAPVRHPCRDLVPDLCRGARGRPHVGDYRLLAPIGEGGMGVVHLAQAPDGRRVALKVLRPHVVGDSEARERLAREVSSLRRITSPRIAEILDADPHGACPTWSPATCPVSRSTTTSRRRGRSRRRPAALRRCLAEALQAVHSVGVLHRDIKPTNVLMEGRSPVLIDFGLARVAEDARLTRTGWLLGTPGYLAPRSCTATTPARPPTCTPGRRRWSSRQPGGRRTARARRWR